MRVVQWDELTSAEQYAFERVASGDTSRITQAIIARLKELGLAEDRPDGVAISQAGLKFLAARGMPPHS